MPDLHERVYAWLCKKSKGSAAGKLRCSGILDKLRTEVVNDPVSLRKALIHLRTEQLVEYAAGQHGEPISGFMTVVRPQQEVPPYVETWSAVLGDAPLSEADKFALLPVGGAMEGFSAEDMKTLLNGLVRLRANQAQHFGEQVFSVSAMYLMGSSKLLTTGTPFANRKLPFKQLMLLIYEFVSSPKGCSTNATHPKLEMTCRTAYQNFSKLREAIYEQADLTPLSGTVQIDGGHFCGKPRRPRKRAKSTSSIVNNKLRNRKAGMVPNGTTHLEPWNQEKFKNRRIVLTMRQLSNVRGQGAERTIVRIIMAEKAQHVLPVIKKYVCPGATIQTDEGHAYSSLIAWYNHETVCHSVEYSTDTGVNNNQAESFFGRMRRAEYGTYHGMRPQYLAFYASEFAWREDTRPLSLGQKFDDILGKVLRCGLSKAWRGYFQGNRLGLEYLG